MPCAEGAIVLVGGKAKVMNESLCDGAGFCIPICPAGALSLEQREAPGFDEAAAEAHMEAQGVQVMTQHCFAATPAKSRRRCCRCGTKGAAFGSAPAACRL